MLAKSSPLIPVLLREYHDSSLGGHARELKTYLRLAGEWHWEGMRRQVTRYVRKCQVCQQAKTSNLSPAGLLQNLSTPSQVWEHVMMDFIEGLTRSKGVDTILVVVDRLTKFGHFVALKHPFTTFQVAEKIVKEVVKLHGFPTTIVSDRDKVFMSVFWRNTLALANSFT